MDFDVDAFLDGRPLAITPAGLQELRAHIAARISLLNTAPVDAVHAIVIDAAERREAAEKRHRRGAVGVIQIRGTISQHARGDTSAALVGGTSTEDVAAQLDEYLADEEIGKIVLDIDSPGGASYGVTELAAKIRASRGEKPIVAVANSLMASAAYWIGAQADYVYSTPGGMVGSIGAYTVHQDVSGAGEKLGIKTTLISAGKHKVRGNQFEPLADDARAAIQERVDAVYDQFVGDVAKGRGVTDARVRGGYGEGDVLDAKKAKAEGLIDGIATLDQVIQRAFKPRASQDLGDRADNAAAGFQRDVTAAQDAIDQATDDDEPNDTPAPDAPYDDTGDEGETGAKLLGQMRLRRLRDNAAAAAQQLAPGAIVEV